MKPIAQIVAVLVVVVLGGSLRAETVRFTDGTSMEVTRFEIRDDVVVLVTPDGKLRSVPRSYLDLDAMPDEASIEAEAIELIGLRRMTDQIAMSARRAAAELEAEPEDGRRISEIVKDAMTRGFERDFVYRVAEDTFRERSTRSNLQDALVWLRTPLARRMDRAAGEVSKESPETYWAELGSSPPESSRVELLLRLDRATGTSDAAVQMQAAMMKATLHGLHGSRPSSDAAIEEALAQARPRLKQQTRARIQLSLHFMYRDISDEELERYLTYLESEPGRWLSDVLMRSLFAAMEAGARRSGELLAEHLRELSKIRA